MHKSDACTAKAVMGGSMTVLQLRLELPQEKSWEDGCGQWIILNVAGSSSFNRLHSGLKVLCWIVYVCIQYLSCWSLSRWAEAVSLAAWINSKIWIVISDLQL